MAEHWTGLDDGDALVWELASAAEIRRRGQGWARRRRTRRASVATLATTAVVAIPGWLAASPGGPAVGVPVALDGVPPVSSHPGDPEGSTRPRPGAWLDAVPADFALAAGMSSAPVITSPPADRALRGGTTCGEARWVQGLGEGTVDARLAVDRYAGRPDERRTLLLYPDDRAARAAFTEATRSATTCEDTAAGSEASFSDEVGGSAVDDSWSYVVTGASTSGGAAVSESVVVVRVGNALLLDNAASAGPASAAGVSTWLAERVLPVAGQLCVFAEEPCTD